MRSALRAGLLASVTVTGCKDFSSETTAPFSTEHSTGPPQVFSISPRVSADDSEEFADLLWSSTSPFDALVFDPSRDRFVLPGRFALARDGTVTLGPDPIEGPTTTTADDLSSLRRKLHLCRRSWARDEQCETEGDTGYRAGVAYAVHYASDSTVVLFGTFGAHGSSERLRFPDTVSVLALDPDTLDPIDGTEFELPWEGELFEGNAPMQVQSVLDRFARHGTLIIDAAPGRGSWGRRAKHRLTRGRGRVARIRVDADGARTVLVRGRWRIIASEYGLRNAGAARALFRSTVGGRVWAARSADGVYTLETGTKDDLVTSYDRNLEVRWRHSSPEHVHDWTVDEDGWIYLWVTSPAVDGEGTDRRSHANIVAITPQGEVAWTAPLPPTPPFERWSDPPAGQMLVAGDAVCHYAMFGPVPTDPASTPQLTCFSPRHV